MCAYISTNREAKQRSGWLTLLWSGNLNKIFQAVLLMPLWVLSVHSIALGEKREQKFYSSFEILVLIVGVAAQKCISTGVPQTACFRCGCSAYAVWMSKSLQVPSLLYWMIARVVVGFACASLFLNYSEFPFICIVNSYFVSFVLIINTYSKHSTLLSSSKYLHW